MLSRDKQSPLDLRQFVCVLSIFVGSACANDAPLAPQAASNLAAPRVTSQTVNAGDEVLLFMGWGIAPETEMDLIVTGRGEVQGPSGCAQASYTYDVTVQQKFVSGNTHFPGAEKPNSAELFQPGTRLRFLRWVTMCQGAYNVYAFEVISVPGNDK